MLQPPRGCGEGWGPAVGPQRLLRTFSMLVALACVEEGETEGRTPWGQQRQPPLQLPISGLIALGDTQSHSFAFKLPPR